MEYLTGDGQRAPAPSRPGDIECGDGEFVNLVYATVRDNRAVRRNVSIPAWMDELAAREGLSLSRIMQDTLSARYNR
jgi:hypothetical protein